MQKTRSKNSHAWAPLRSPEIDFKESPGGPVRQIGLSYRPARLRIDSWAPQKVYEYGLCFPPGEAKVVLGPYTPLDTILQKSLQFPHTQFPQPRIQGSNRNIEILCTNTSVLTLLHLKKTRVRRLKRTIKI